MSAHIVVLTSSCTVYMNTPGTVRCIYVCTHAELYGTNEYTRDCTFVYICVCAHAKLYGTVYEYIRDCRYVNTLGTVRYMNTLGAVYT